MYTHMCLWYVFFQWKPNISQVGFQPLHIPHHYWSPELASETGELCSFPGHQTWMSDNLDEWLLVDMQSIVVPAAKMLKYFHMVFLSPYVSRPPSWSSRSRLSPLTPPHSGLLHQPETKGLPPGQQDIQALPIQAALRQPPFQLVCSIYVVLIIKYFLYHPVAETSLEMLQNEENYTCCNFRQGTHCRQSGEIVLKFWRWKVRLNLK